MIPIQKCPAIYMAILVLAVASPVQAEGASHGVLEVDPHSGAAFVCMPLGPGIGRPGLTYRPALVGCFAPKVAPRSEVCPQVGGFALTPGTLELRFGAGEPPCPALAAVWTYPDGTGESALVAASSSLAPSVLRERFGYTPLGSQVEEASTGSVFPSALILAGAGGACLMALPSEAAEGASASPLPQRLLAVRAGLAYEFETVQCCPSVETSAPYRLKAVRSESGENILFTYGHNGFDFEASWGEAKVRVTLEGWGPVFPVPALEDATVGTFCKDPAESFRATEALMRVAYDGPGQGGSFTVSTLGSRKDALAAAQKGWDAPRRSMQVTQVVADSDGEAIHLAYRKGPMIRQDSQEGTLHFAPTVLSEIALPGRTLRLDWGAAPCGSNPEAWSFGVAEVQDLAFKEGAMTPCAPLYRRIPDGSGRTSWNGSWVRQSRHFALEDAPGVQNCHTHVRDRWELTAKGGVSPYAFDEDIPTFALDPKTQTLEPALGRLTRWLNWDQKAMDLNQPPDVHEHHRHGNTLRMGLLGGSGRGWFVKPGPIRYDPVRHEVTMGATSGPQPPSGANIFVPAHNSGPASVAQQLARQNQIEQDIAQRSAASTAWAQQQSAMGARSCLQAQQDGVAAQRARMDQQIKAQNEPVRNFVCEPLPAGEHGAWQSHPKYSKSF